jgi:hypothetical protein
LEAKREQIRWIPEESTMNAEVLTARLQIAAARRKAEAERQTRPAKADAKKCPCTDHPSVSDAPG